MTMHSTDFTDIMNEFPARVAVWPRNFILAGESHTCLRSLTAAVNTEQAMSVVTSLRPPHMCHVVRAEKSYYPY